MTGQPEHVVVVGAGLGGLRTAEALRSSGHQGRISLVGAEQHLPYDRPPLSKQVLTGEWEPHRAVLRDAEALDDLGVRLHAGRSAVGLHPGRVELSDGTSLLGDAVVLATGVAAVRLPGQPDGVHVLRTLDDAVALAADLRRVSSLLIVGAGFVGAEVASAARGRGIAVTVLEALAVPFGRALGERVGGLCARLLTDAGVQLRAGTPVTAFTGATGVDLAGGDRVSADAVLVGVGAVPVLAWLAGSGLAVDGGLVCDSRGRAQDTDGDRVDGVWAVGDVAAWTDPVHGDRRRTEHWTSATQQATAVARDILGAPAPAPAVPYLWSDQFGLKIQVFGRPELAETTVALHGAGLDGGAVAGTVVGYAAAGRLVAVAGFGSARRTVGYRKLVAGQATLDDAVRVAADLG